MHYNMIIYINIIASYYNTIIYNGVNWSSIMLFILSIYECPEVEIQSF